MKKLPRPVWLLLMLLMTSFFGSLPGQAESLPEVTVASDALLLETAFIKAFNDPEEFKATGIFQLLGYNAVEIAEIGKITPRPASVSVEFAAGPLPGMFRSLRVKWSRVLYYNLTIETVQFDFPECSIDVAELAAGRLRFKTGGQISLVTDVSADDILKVFAFYARSRSLSGLKMKLAKNSARLHGRVKKGLFTAEFKLNGNTRLINAKTVTFNCERLFLNGMSMPRNVIATIFRQINPVFDSRKTWLNLNISSITINPGFVQTHATIDRKKG